MRGAELHERSAVHIHCVRMSFLLRRCVDTFVSMEQVINAPTALIWSCDIPALEITTSEDSLALQVQVDSALVQELTLYAYNGSITMWELQELVEAYMRDHSLYHGEVSVIHGASSLCSFECIHLAGLMLGDCQSWCANHFLTLAPSKQLVPGVEDVLYYHGADNQASVSVTYRADGGARVVSGALSVNGCVTVSVESLEEMFSVTDILCVTIRVGTRRMYYYVNQELSPDYVFLCVNFFGVLEVVPINCSTSANQVGTRTVSSVNRNAVLALLNHEVEHEVETAPLSPLQCSIVEQLCESPTVWLLPGMTPVVIKDRTCEYSDERGALQSVKFTWRTLSGRRIANIETQDPGNIFTEEYNEVYG